MEKRVEKNKKLYEQVNKEISKIARAHSNDEFKATNETLKNIDPQLFGNESISDNQKKPTQNKTKILVSSLVFVGILLLVIFIAVVIYYGTK